MVSGSVVAEVERAGGPRRGRDLGRLGMGASASGPLSESEEEGRGVPGPRGSAEGEVCGPAGPASGVCGGDLGPPWGMTGEVLAVGLGRRSRMLRRPADLRANRARSIAQYATRFGPALATLEVPW